MKDQQSGVPQQRPQQYTQQLPLPQQQVQYGQRKQKKSGPSLGKIFGRIFLTLIVLVVIVMIAIEFGARWLIGKEMSDQYAAQATNTGTVMVKDPTISFGSSPLLFSFITKNVPQIKMETPSTLVITRPNGPTAAPEIHGVPAAAISITNMDIHSMDAPIAEDIRVTTLVPDELMLATVQRETINQLTIAGDSVGALLAKRFIKVTDIVSDPSNETIKVRFTGGLATLALHPYAEAGGVRMTAVDAKLLGFGLPGKVSELISSALNQATENVTTGALQLTHVDVEQGGLEFTLHGDNINLNEMNGQS